MAEAPSQVDREGRPAVRYQPLVIVLAAVCAGVVADRRWAVPLSTWLTLTAAAWTSWLLLWQGRWDRAASVVLLASVGACGGAWHHLRWEFFDRDDLGHFARREKQPVCVEAVAIKGPRRVPAPEFDPMQIIPVGDRTQVELEVTGIRDGVNWRPASGRSRLTVDGHLLGVHAGDRLRIFGHLYGPRPVENPGGFDFAARDRADRRLCQLRSESPDCVSRVGRGGPGNPGTWVQWVRTAGDRLLWRHVRHRRAGLAAAVLLGAREEVGIERSQAFMETGTVHLLAISGLHVGIVAGALFLGLRLTLVRRSHAALIVAAATVLYALLADARPPAVRAAILVVVLCAGTCLGRPRLAFNSLGAAGLVLLASNPTHLFHTGAQLSFLAVAGLMWFGPRWFGTAPESERIARLVWQSRGWLGKVFWLVRRSLGHLTRVSVMLWLLTLPLVMARFHLFSPGAVVLNTVLWFPMALALAGGFGVLVFGWLFPPLAWVFGRWCDGSLWALESCIEFARGVPCSHFWVPGPADWWLLGFYGGLGALAMFPWIRPPRRWCVAMLAGWTAAGLAPALFRTSQGRLECTFLSVGHGCAVVLELPSGQTVLYDAGQFALPAVGGRSIAEFLWSRGITHVDAVILSHPDADHYNAVPELLRRVSVGVFYVSEVMFQRETSALNSLREAIRESQVPIRGISGGDRLRGGEGCVIEVLHPPRDWVLGDDNASSLVLAVEYLGRRILLPGDLDPPGLDAVLAESPWDCDVLLAPHHGSRGSNPPGLAAWCTPEWVLISGGLSDYHAETAAAYRAAGADVLHTAQDGAVRASMTADGLEVTATQSVLPTPIKPPNAVTTSRSPAT